MAHVFYKTLNPCNINRLNSNVVVHDRNLTHSNQNINFHVTKSKPNLSINNVNGKVFKNFPKIEYWFCSLNTLNYHNCHQGLRVSRVLRFRVFKTGFRVFFKELGFRVFLSSKFLNVFLTPTHGLQEWGLDMFGLVSCGLECVQIVCKATNLWHGWYGHLCWMFELKSAKFVSISCYLKETKLGNDHMQFRISWYFAQLGVRMMKKEPSTEEVAILIDGNKSPIDADLKDNKRYSIRSTFSRLCSGIIHPHSLWIQI